MMTPHNLRVWAKIQEQLVRVEAMKAENQSRDDKGYAQAYSEDLFDEIADEISRLSASFEDSN